MGSKNYHKREMDFWNAVTLERGNGLNLDFL